MRDDYAANELLIDGTPIRIRAIRPDDKQRLLEHFHHLSQTAVYHRFFGPKRRLSKQEVIDLTRFDPASRVGLCASFDDDRFIGVGRYIVEPCGTAGGKSAELAFAVLDEYQGRGIGTLLLKHLAMVARENGVQQLRAMVLADNRQMLEVFANSGFRKRTESEDGTVTIVLWLDTGMPTGTGASRT